MRRGAAQRARARCGAGSTMPSRSASVQRRRRADARRRLSSSTCADARRAAGAPSRRSARRSGRTRTGSRRRATASVGVGADQVARRCTVVDSSENSALTGPSESTQVSFERPPRCIAMTARVLVAGDARQPARHHAPAARRRDREDAQADGARRERPRDAPLPLEHRRLRDVHPLLRDVVLRPRARRARRSASRPSADEVADERSAARCGERSIGLMISWSRRSPRVLERGRLAAATRSRPTAAAAARRAARRLRRGR